MKEQVGRPIKIDGMAYAPMNEQGVVFLFGRLAPGLGFHVELVQTHFPDCLARRKGKLHRIEFEYYASSYEGHPPKGTDIIVCWENDGETRPQKYRQLEIIDLKKYVGARPRVFQVGCDEEDNGRYLEKAWTKWNVPRSAQVDDLIVMYRKHPTSAIRDLWRVVGPFKDWKKNNKQGRKPGLQTVIRNVVRLDRPVTYAELKVDSNTRTLGVVEKRFQGMTDVTEDWHLLYAKIVDLNPRVKKSLQKYAPF